MEKNKLINFSGPFVFRWLCKLLFCTCLTATSQAVTVSFNSANNPPIVAASYDAGGQTLDITLDFAPPAGTNLMVVRNTGTAFIEGAFANVPNGALVELIHEGITYSYVAWYYGGDGNDLVLHWRYAGLAHWGLVNYETPSYPGPVYFHRAPSAASQAGVLAGKTIVQMAAGCRHTLALTSEGRVYAWGSNDSGELGNNSTADSYSPVAVNTVEGMSALHGKTVVAVSAGAYYSLALCSDGSVTAWGNNSGGRLGDGSEMNRAVPVMVSTAAGSSALAGRTVTAISAGYMHSLVRCSDGTIAGWGDNASGQLGNNQHAFSTLPVSPDAAAGASALEGRSVVAVAAGDMFSVALCSDGTVVAWGYNAEGQLGDNTTTYRHVPGPVNTDAGTSALSGKTVVDLVAGDAHVLALCSDGAVAAWGDNRNGQLGNGTTTSQSVPVSVTAPESSGYLTGRNVVALAAGSGHSLALCSDGTLAAWGGNGSGQLGDNAQSNRSTPVAVSTAAGTSVLARRKVTALALGGTAQHSLALYQAEPPGLAVELPEGVPLVDGTSHVSLGTAPLGGLVTRSVIIRNLGGLPLSLGTMTLEAPGAAAFAVDVSSLETVVEAGASTTFLLKFFPATAGDFTASLHIASNAPGPASSFDFTVGGTGRTQAAWNSVTEVPFTVENLDASGQRMDLSLDFAPPPGKDLMLVRHNRRQDFIQGTFVNLPEGASVQMSHGGTVYTYVPWYRGGDGNDLVLLWPHRGLASWGANGKGQLGHGSNVNRSAPTAVDQAGALLGKTIVQVARGLSHALALGADGTVYAWGNNEHGQVGDGTTNDRSLPVMVSTAPATSALAGKKVVSICAGAYHSLALCSDGTLVAWGLNTSGQLGDSSSLSRSEPVTVTVSAALMGKHVTALAAGGWHSLALCSDGSVAAWGENLRGQLGQGATSSGSTTPVSVNAAPGVSALSGKTVTAVAAGTYHSLALCSDGSLAAWGNNDNGQLGDNTSTQRAAPVAVNTTSGISALHGRLVEAIAVGSVHSLALCSDGTVAAWGYNGSGQLGNAGLVLHRAPVEVSAAAGSSALAGRSVTSITAGSFHSLALCSDGTVAAWGLNTSGQLGDNTQTARNTPVTASVEAGVSTLAARRVFSLSSGCVAAFSTVLIMRRLPISLSSSLRAPRLPAARVCILARPLWDRPACQKISRCAMPETFPWHWPASASPGRILPPLEWTLR